MQPSNPIKLNEACHRDLWPHTYTKKLKSIKNNKQEVRRSSIDQETKSKIMMGYERRWEKVWQGGSRDGGEMGGEREGGGENEKWANDMLICTTSRTKVQRCERRCQSSIVNGRPKGILCAITWHYNYLLPATYSIRTISATTTIKNIVITPQVKSITQTVLIIVT